MEDRNFFLRRTSRVPRLEVVDASENGLHSVRVQALVKNPQVPLIDQEGRQLNVLQAFDGEQLE